MSDASCGRGARAIPGKKRERNEDSYLVDPDDSA